MRRFLIVLVAGMSVALPARAAPITFTGCYEQRSTTPVPAEMLRGSLPPTFEPATLDPAGLVGEYTARAFQCGTADLMDEFMFVTIPIRAAGGGSVPASSHALVHAFSEHEGLTAALFAGCFGNVTQDASIVFGVVDAGPARTGLVFNDAGIDGVGMQNLVEVFLGARPGDAGRLYTRRGTTVHAMEFGQGSATVMAGQGALTFQSGAGPLTTPAQPAVVEHRFDGASITLNPLSSC